MSDGVEPFSLGPCCALRLTGHDRVEAIAPRAADVGSGEGDETAIVLVLVPWNISSHAYNRELFQSALGRGRGFSS
jgi:hypothetical protein